MTRRTLTRGRTQGQGVRPGRHLTPDVRTKLIEMGLDPKGGTPDQFAEHVRRELAKWSDVAKRANIRVD